MYPKISGRILGIDCSYCQGDMPWRELADAGVRFAWHKATEGISIVDKYYNKNQFSVLQEPGIVLFGAYHFFQPSSDPVLQAQLFHSIAGAASTGIPALDMETFRGSNPTETLKKALVFLDETEQLWGCQTMVYTAPYIMTALAAAPPECLDALAKRRLWIAHWGPSTPIIPKPWKTWSLWQFDGDLGMVMPNGRDADFDWFQGTEEELVSELGRKAPAL